MLVGIILSAIAPAISSIYSVPSEWVGLKPAMILFNRFTHENLEEVNSLGELELGKTVRVHSEAAGIIAQYLSSSQDLLMQHPEISEAYREVNIGVRKAQELYVIKRQEREVREKQQRQQQELKEEQQRQERLRDEEQKKQEERTYWQNVQRERSKRGLHHGVPPIDNCRCPAHCPIRATAKINEPNARGIYYYPGERAGVEVYWCFASREEAEADNFRRPYKKPPKQQPR